MQEERRRVAKPIIIAILLILVLVIGSHFILPILGISIAIAAGLWGVAVATTAVVCVAILLFFLFSGIGFFVVGAISIVWAIIALILFPILFPMIAPLIILVVLIAILLRR